MLESVDLATVWKSSFDPHVNSTFSVQLAPDLRVDLELVQITEKRYSNTESFSLFFRGPRDIYLASMMHRLEHEAMGVLDVLITPVGKDDEGVNYQAVLCRLLEEVSHYRGCVTGISGVSWATVARRLIGRMGRGASKSSGGDDPKGACLGHSKGTRPQGPGALRRATRIKRRVLCRCRL